MSLLIRLDKLNKDVTLSEEEKYNVFQELLQSFLAKAKFNDFKTLLNYYQFNSETLYNILTRAIEQDKITYVKHITHNYNPIGEGGIYNKIPVRIEDLKHSITLKKVDILKYLLNQCSNITNELLFYTNENEILSVLVEHGINPEPKLDITIQKCMMMNKMTDYIEKWCTRGDTYSMRYLMHYLDNYVNLCSKNKEKRSTVLLCQMTENLRRMIQKEYNIKTLFLSNFYLFLEQNDEDDISRINIFLVSVM